jgi:cobaltochelatase CobS
MAKGLQDPVGAANTVLNFLKDHDWAHTTNSLVYQLGLEVPGDRPAVRDLLHKMAAAGLLRGEKDGSKFRWEITQREWVPALPELRGARRRSPRGQHPGPGAPAGDFEDRLRRLEDYHAGEGAAAREVVEIIKDFRSWKAIAEAHATALASRLMDLEGKVGAARPVEVRRYDRKKVDLGTATAPAYFERVVSLAAMRRNILLVGPTGCGKTTIAELTAKTLGLPFGKVGGSGGLQEIHLLGRSRPNLTTGEDTFGETEFLRCYEHGGLCLVDELDAADQNVLLALNPALDRSGLLPLPNRPGRPAKRHKDFVCIATANTTGRGATRQYAGRNQLDEATLDRFRIGTVECDFDEAVERAVCPDDLLRGQLQKIRRGVEAAGLRRVVSTRFLEDAHLMVSQGGWTREEAVGVLFSGWSEDEKSKVLENLT